MVLPLPQCLAMRPFCLLLFTLLLAPLPLTITLCLAFRLSLHLTTALVLNATGPSATAGCWTSRKV
jgi:hypothetical protein